MLRAQQHNGDHQERQRGRGGQLRLGRILEQAPDFGRHGVESGRQRKNCGRAEQDHGLQECDQNAGEQRRQRERNRNAARGRPDAGTEHRRGIFQVARDAVERVCNQHEDVGERVAGDDEDEPRQGIDIEQVLVLRRPGDQPIELVQQPAVGRRKYLPRHRAEERRRHERGGDQRPDGMLHRQVGARDQPAHRRGDHTAQSGGTHRHDDCRDQRLDEVRIGKERAKVLEREDADIGRGVTDRETVVDEPRNRQDDEHAQQRGKREQDRYARGQS